MNEPWEQSTGLDDDDFVEGIDDEDEELSASPEPKRPAHALVPRAVRRALPTGKPGQGPRKYRVKPMSARMAGRSKGVASILITKEDGSQILFVKQ